MSMLSWRRLGMAAVLFVAGFWSITALAQATRPTLTVTPIGNGTVVSSPAGINCGSTCQASFDKGTVVTLTASPLAGWRVKSWGSGCTGSVGETCTISVSTNRTATVTFEPVSTEMHTLKLTRTGSGTVTSAPAGINCGSTCTGSFAKGTQVKLTATPANGWVFKRWGGGCTGSSGTTCTIAISQNRTATVTFERVSGTPLHALTVTRTGSGSITSSPTGLNCSGSTCTGSFAENSTVTLTATAAAGWRLKRWGGGCTGSSGNTCSIAMPKARTATVTFEEIPGGAPMHTLTVTRTGTGAVVSSPEGLSCSGSTCTGSFAKGTQVNLSATPGSGWIFKRWGGGCTGSSGNACTIAISQNRSATVTFEEVPGGAPMHTLTVTRTGNGAVVSSPEGLSCSGSTCTGSFAKGTQVNLIATPASGWIFKRWGGGCTGSSGNACTISISQNRTATVTFDAIAAGMHPLTISKTGLGHVLSSPAGIDCGPTCMASFDAGTTVTLTATPQSGSVFANWTGACAGTAPTCTVVMSMARDVGAAFNAASGHTLTVTKAGSGSGTVTSSPAAINCGATCAASFAAGTTVTLTASATAGSTFSGWTGACVGNAATCTVVMSAARSVGATFNAISGYTLTVTKTGSGGTVTSSPAGIDCGTSCSHAFVAGTTVTLTATRASILYKFDGWTGACSGTASTCTVTMNAAKSVGAKFSLIIVGPLSNPIRQLSAGGDHACGVNTGGRVYCWGSNQYGRLGDGTTTDQKTPKQVSGLTGVRMVSAGQSHTCAVTTADEVWCWGYNGSGRLGDGTTTNRSTPKKVNLSGVAFVHAGYDSTCAITNSGAIQCWGWLAGSTTPKAAPAGVTPARGVEVGFAHACALTSAGAVKCWGWNTFGELGNNGTSDSMDTAVQVSGLTSGVRSISAHLGRHTCAHKTNGEVWCWGHNVNGQLGDGTTTNRSAPVKITVPLGIDTVSAGSAHTCTNGSFLVSINPIRLEKAIACWGNNGSGRLGDGTTTGRTSYVRVKDLSETAAFLPSAGGSHSCAVSRDGSVRCWGANGKGQLGDNSTTNRLKPVAVSGLTSDGGLIYASTSLVQITDNNATGVSSSITVSGASGNASSSTQVHVVIKHVFIGDLRVRLKAPDGTTHTLHNRTGGANDNIDKIYTLDLSGKPRNGTWTLLVSDEDAGASGYLDRWDIRF